MAESIIGLYKTALVRNIGPWRGLDDRELATLEWSTGSTAAGSAKTTAGSHPPSSKPSTTVTNPQATRPRLKPTSLHRTRGGSGYPPAGRRAP